MVEGTFEYKPSFWRKVKKKFAFLLDIHSSFYFVLLLIGISLLFYIAPLLKGNFSTLYTGDYTMQYIPMGFNQYDDWHTFFKTGQFVFWDPNTFLGADNITSNAYYYLFSPFFLPIIIFPRSFVPQAMAILSIVRIVLGGMVFRTYLKKMSAKEFSARIGAIAFAFCGWMAWYLWFNNFLDMIVVFPLILLGIEKVLQDKKPWLLAFSLFLLSICNFFLLPALTICAFLYAMWRYFHRLKLNNWKTNLAILGIGFSGFVVGLMMGLVIFYPCFIASQSSSRYTGATYLDRLKEFYEVGDFKNLLKVVFSWKFADGDRDRSYRLYYPIIDFFVPPISDRGTPLVYGVSGLLSYDQMAGSLWSATPITMLFIPAVIQSVKEKKYTVFIAIAFFIFSLFSPFISYALFGLTTEYLRWSIFLNTSIITYSVLYIDKMKDSFKWSLSLGAIFTIAGVVAAGFTASYLLKEYSVFAERVPIFWTCAIEITVIVVTYFIIRFFYDKSYLHYLMLGMVIIESIAVGNLVAYGHTSFSAEDVAANNGTTINNSLSGVINKINDLDKTYFRTYTTLDNGRSSNNGMMNNYNGTQMFHTLYNYNVKDFKWWTGWSDGYDGWSAYNMNKRANLDAFLGIKYYVIQKNKTKMDILEEADVNVPLHAIEVPELENEDFYVFKNEFVSQLGFSYDEIIGYTDDNSSGGAGTFVYRYDPFDLLLCEQMFLETAIVDINSVDEILSIAQDDITKLENKANYSSSTFTGFKKVVTNNTPNSGYKKQIFKVLNTDSYDVNKLGDIPLNYIQQEGAQYSSTNDHYFIFVSRDDNQTFEFDEGTAVYINSPYMLNQKVDIYLIDEDGKVITYDNHNDDTYTLNRSQGIRGFYARREIKSIVIRPRFTNVPNIHIAIETGKNFDDRINNLKALENVTYVSTNKFTFTTNYDKYRYVVTTIPYEKGWKVISTDKDGHAESLKVYKSQGGFVGFLTKPGEFTYEMKYLNDDLVTGGIVSAVGTFMFVTSYLIFLIIEKKKKPSKMVN
ncbi:MAG: YfhO family protein [Bacilli bacterium]